MENSKGYQFTRRHRFVILGGTIAVSLMLILVLLTWSSLVSAQANTIPVQSVQSGNFAQESIQVEFIYHGDNLANATTAADEFASLLSQETGFSVTASIQPCETIVVEHLGSGQADLAPLSRVAYVFGHEDYGIEARLVNGRFGQFNFRGQFNVQATSGYTSNFD